ncbi:hypothetical protein D9613_012440 [Agrocybe pediades]|uniref:Nephrocystin 3-like N-terminal domain-containing protein n=1 Tax=Agrocybe pediades TaxID=84607 RepID=A0A8H4QRS8_9AGAR|nr:hypothetical protein D9613_012440 [Agrocybe pediades]
MDAGSQRTTQVPLFSPQTLISGGTITQVLGNYNDYRGSGLGKGGFERLEEACAPSAFHNSDDSYDQPKCHPNTRVAILKTIIDLIAERRQPAATTDDASSPVSFVFLTGPAGAGKSAIANTVAGRCQDEGRLLASFFFRSTDHSRNNIRPFFPTIAYQICLAIPQLRNYIAATIERDPLILRKSPSLQLNSLLVNPLLHLLHSGLFDIASAPYCVIIDGLDECVDKKARCELLEILTSTVTRTNLPLVFFIASRPEYDILSVINSQNLANISNRLYLYDNNADIFLYLHDNFNNIKATHPSRRLIPPNWPSDASLRELVRKASGHFIYAATVIKYVSSIRYDPMERLELVLTPHYNRKDTPFAELDALYMHILSEVEDVEILLRILSFCRLSSKYPMACSLPIWVLGYTEIMFQRQMMNLLPMLRSNLASLVTVVDESYLNGTHLPFLLHVHHASLTDFLSDRHRSGRYYMDLCWWRREHIAAIFRYFEYFLGCESETVIELQTLLRALHFIEMNLNHTSIKTVFDHFSQFSIEDLHGIIFERESQEIPRISGELYDLLLKLEGLPSSPESSTLHNRLSQVYDKHLRNTLSVYRQYPRLRCLLTILPYATRCSEDRVKCIAHLDVFGNLLVGDSMDKDSLIDSLNTQLHYGPSREDSMAFTAGFLKDPNRAGPSALRGMDYPYMALKCLELLRDTTFFTQQHANSRYLARKRRNTPFLSLHKRDSLYRLYKLTGLHHSRCRLLDMCGPWNNFYRAVKWSRKFVKTVFRAFKKFLLVGLALCYLPYLLKHSCKHEELEARLRQIVFPPYAFRHPKKLALVRKAIAKYVQGE